MTTPPDDEERTPVWVTITCHTEGCPLEGQPRHIQAYANVDGDWRIICGQCDQYVTDVVPD